MGSYTNHKGEFMTYRSARLFSILVLASCITASAFAQGLYWESTRTNSMMGRANTTQEKAYYMPGMFKTEDNDQSIIFRMDQEKMYMIDPNEKTYSAVTFAEMQQMMEKASGKMDEQMAEMKKRMAEMPEEQQKMMEKMLGEKMQGIMGSDSKVEAEKTSEHEQIAGFPTTKYIVTQNGNEFASLWTTTDVKGYESMKKDFTELSKRMTEMSPAGIKAMYEGMQKVEGFPVKMEMEGMTSVVTKIDHRAIPKSEFEVPAGYKQVESPIKKSMEKMDEK